MAFSVVFVLQETQNILFLQPIKNNEFGFQMIQELKIRNFLSFKDEVTLSFEATDDTTFEDYHVVEVADGVRLLRFAMVYGANASGKSNLLEAFDFLRGFWHTQKSRVEERVNVQPFLLDAETPIEPSEFSLKFYVGSVCYLYQLKVNPKYVEKECLYICRDSQEALLFDREIENGSSVLRFGKDLNVSAAAQEAITLRLLNNVSFFVARGGVNVSLPYIDAVMAWMYEHVMGCIEPKTEMMAYAGRKMSESEALQDYVQDFIHRADFNITHVSTEKVKEPLNDMMRTFVQASDSLSSKSKETLLNEGMVNYKMLFEHTVKNARGIEKYTLSDRLQSNGTLRISGIEAAMYDAVSRECFLSVDEIEASLHPDLVEFIIQDFLERKNHSQLLITTHYDPLLDAVGDLIRKDSIWFTEKGEDGSTDLYSLVEFDGLDDLKSFRRSYRNGLFGALPNVKA